MHWGVLPKVLMTFVSQVLLDALIYGFVRMKQLALVVFDEGDF